MSSLKSQEAFDHWLSRNKLRREKKSQIKTPKVVCCPSNHRTSTTLDFLNYYRPYTCTSGLQSLSSEEKRCNIIYHTIVVLFVFVVLIGLFVWEITLVAVGIIGIVLLLTVIPGVKGNCNDRKPRPY